MNGRLDRLPITKRYAGATGGDLHIDAPLTNLTIGYRPQNLIADRIYPAVPVDKESNNYYVWRQSDWFRVVNAERSRGTAAKRVQFSVSSERYVAKNYSLGMELPMEDLGNADAALGLRETAAFFVEDLLHLAWEDRIAVTLTTTTNMGSSTSLANRWSDEINGTPVRDIFTGFESIRLATGYKANKMLFSGTAWNNFRQHPDIIDFVRGKGDNVGGGPVTEAQVAAAFGVSEVLLGLGTKNTADEDAPAVYTDIWSTACVLLYVAPAPGIMQPSHGYTFQWTVPGMPGPFTVDRYAERRTRVEVVEVDHYQAEQVTGVPLGYLIVNT